LWPAVGTGLTGLHELFEIEASLPALDLAKISARPRSAPDVWHVATLSGVSLRIFRIAGATEEDAHAARRDDPALVRVVTPRLDEPS